MEGRQLLLLALLPMVIGLPMEHASESVNFMNGFPVNFAEGLPTDEFNSALSGLSRSKRQVGVSEHIRDMLSEPYNGPKPSDISSLFERNSLDRPVRESPSSDSTRFPQPFQPSSTFLENLFQQPARQQVRKPVPQPPRQSFQQPVRRPVKAQPTRQTVQQVERKPQPTRQTVQQVERRPQPTRQTVQQVERRPQPTRQTVQQVERRPQQNFSPESRFPSFSEAQAEHKRTNDENTNHFTNADFFESARIREKRDITTNQAPEAEARADSEHHKGFVPNNFPSFLSIGGFDRMPVPDQSSNSFVPKFNPPKISIPDIQEEQPQFSIPHFAQKRLDTSQPLYFEQPESRSRVMPFILQEQLNEVETNLQPLQSVLSRKRRQAGEPDPIDPSQNPHKIVPSDEKTSKSAGDESLIPHIEVPKQHKEIDQQKTGSKLLMTRIPLTSIKRSSHTPFESFPNFHFPAFESERLSDRLTHTKFIPERFTSEFGSSLRNPTISGSDHILPESQRLYPTYNPRRNKPSSSKPFFPPTHRAPGPPLPRSHFNANAHETTRGSTFRPSHRPSSGPKEFRDFRDTFYGPGHEGGREAFHRPDFHFPSSPPHREHEYPSENSLLGSGNFEILRGGTFYEPGDYHLNHHPYDHLLDGGYSPFHSNSHSNNYVDDYFSNFRDFSEFAARSDSGEGEYHGFSEPMTSIAEPNKDMDHTGEESSITEIQTQLLDKTNNSKEEPKSKKSDKDDTIKNKIPSHRQPKNIQEVLAEIDPTPNYHVTSELVVDEKDPMIAMF